MEENTPTDNPEKETARLEAFSDGVFAIAITLLVLEIKIPTETELKLGLFNALLTKWPSYLSFFIGFFTVLVCWINHHFLFQRIFMTTHSLILACSFILLLVSFAPFPTAILAQSMNGGELQTAVQMFGFAYFLMASSYRILSIFVNKSDKIIVTEKDKRHKKAINRMYDIAIFHTIITLLISFYSVPISLFLYILLFSMFLFPDTYSKLLMKMLDN